MRDSKLKPEFSRTIRALRQPSETAKSLLPKHQEGLTFLSDVRVASLVTEPMLLLEKFTGAMLGGTAVTVLIGNLLICVYTLLLGPTSIIGLMVQVNGLNT
jgi:hypothetical protein